MSSLEKQLLRNKLPPMSSGIGGSGMHGRKINRKRDYTPVSWDKYFSSHKDVEISDKSTFRVYFAGSSGPLLLLLHGGGYSGLTWSLFVDNISQLVECQIAAVDLRGHGESQSSNDEDLSAETLSHDVGAVFQALHGDDPPPVVLIGHSMGGAIAVHIVFQHLIPSVIGLVVIDVVEGTALDALQSMQSFLRSRPPSFCSLQNAIEWCVRSGQVRNVESAKVSMPAQLKNSASNLPATRDINLLDRCDTDSSTAPIPRQFLSDSVPTDRILEEDEDRAGENSENGKNPVDTDVHTTNANSVASSSEFNQFKHPITSLSSSAKYIWRINLAQTEKFWTGWFEGLSNMFLSTFVPKLLLLAGVDRLDKDLTIGQMQGKFQMQVLPQCGHAVHEDVPDKVADAIATFLVRNKFANQLCEFQRPYCGC